MTSSVTVTFAAAYNSVREFSRNFTFVISLSFYTDQEGFVIENGGGSL